MTIWRWTVTLAGYCNISFRHVSGRIKKKKDKPREDIGPGWEYKWIGRKPCSRVTTFRSMISFRYFILIVEHERGGGNLYWYLQSLNQSSATIYSGVYYNVRWYNERMIQRSVYFSIKSWCYNEHKYYNDCQGILSADVAHACAWRVGRSRFDYSASLHLCYRFYGSVISSVQLSACSYNV
jgi:hypothetical protein